MRALEWFLAALVLAGALPPVIGCYQFALAGLHRFRRHRGSIDPALRPRVAVIVPAWNEAAVIGRTIDQLAALEYARDRLRIYVVDDASSDATPELVRAKRTEHPGLVFHLRRESGGEGKAHTINHGLRIIRADDWYDAVLVIDADVLLTPGALRRMTRHFADPAVGAVSGYIKEGTRPGNYLNRFVAFEYVTAQAGARRAQNVLGVHACLAGGAQLLTRETLDAIGGQIDTTTLAEDTVTTFEAQVAGKRVVFEPHAVVWAEEPQDVTGLWKQRMRWARGNVQVTSRFRRVWFRRGRWGRLGGVSFGLIWFTVTLMPVLMVAASTGLIALYLIDANLSAHVFRTLWAVNLATYLFITLSSFSLDPETARRAWREGIAFPGLISLAIIVYAGSPRLFQDAGAAPHGALLTAFVLAVYAWLAGGMVVALLVARLAASGRVRWLVAPLLYVVGYGPLLCAITAGAYVQELRGADLRWEKTEKVGRIGTVT